MKKSLIFGIAFLVMAACNHVTPIEELENLLKIDLTKKDVSFIDRKELWIGPDGYKIETFDVINSDYLSDKTHRMSSMTVRLWRRDTKRVRFTIT